MRLMSEEDRKNNGENEAPYLTFYNCWWVCFVLFFQKNCPGLRSKTKNIFDHLILHNIKWNTISTVYLLDVFLVVVLDYCFCGFIKCLIIGA